MKALLSALCLLGAVTLMPAQESVEPPKNGREPAELLPAKSLFYLHFDGMAGHRKGFDKTVLAKIINEDMGEFFKSFGKGLDQLVTKQNAEEAPMAVAPADAPDEDGPAVKEPVPAPMPVKKQKSNSTLRDYRRGLHVVEQLWDRGILVSADMSDLKDCQITCVFPNAATKKNWDALHRSLKLCLKDNHPVKVVKQRGRTIYQCKEKTQPQSSNVSQISYKVPFGPGALVGTPPLMPPPLTMKKEAAVKPPVADSTPSIYLAWWKEGDHVVLIYGNRPVSGALDVIDGKTPNLTIHPLYKKVTAFKDYENYCRGFVDARSIIDLVVNASESEDKATRGMEAMLRKVIVGQLGLNGIDSLTWHCGFEGKYQRSTVKLNVAEPEQRQGLLKLMSSPISSSPKDLPPLPSDADWVSVHNVDWQRIYDTFTGMYQTMQMGEWISAGGPLSGKMPSVDRQLQEALGMDLREELLGALDTTVVLSSAWSEGPWLLGNTCAIKVKDAQKLEAALDKMFTLLKKASEEPNFVQITKTKYLGATINTVRMPIDPVGVSPSYTILDGWFIVGVFPQNVMSYVWRSKHPAAAWKMPAIADKAILRGLQSGNAKTKLAAVTVNDPRRMAEIFLPFVSLLGQCDGLMQPGLLFDATTLPPTKAITSRLSPNVTAFFEDGDAWRWETWATVDVPSPTELTVLYGALYVGCAGRSSIDIGLPFAARPSSVPVAGGALPAPACLQFAPAVLSETPPEPGHIHDILPEATLPTGGLQGAGTMLPPLTCPVPASAATTGLAGRLGLVPSIPTGMSSGAGETDNDWMRFWFSETPGVAATGTSGTVRPVSEPAPATPPGR